MPVRLAQDADAKGIVSIYAPYVNFTSYSFEYEAPDAEEYIGRMRKISERFPFFVYEKGGDLLGYAYAHAFHERKAYAWLCETTVYTDCRRREKGVAYALYEELLVSLQGMGYRKAIAIIGCPNEGSERFHSRMGFAQTAHFKEMGYKFGAWHDIKWYIKELNPTLAVMDEPLSYAQYARKKAQEPLARPLASCEKT